MSDDNLVEGPFKLIDKRQAEVLLSSQQLQRRLAFWIVRYHNRKRRHSTIGYLSPIDYEQQYIAARTPTTGRP